MSKRDYYEILEVTKTAGDQEIKSSYRKLAIKYHPDKNPDNPVAEEKFKEAAEAYSVLSDSEKRARYDQFGHAGVGAGAGAGWDPQGFTNIEDIFSEFFGFGGASSSRSTRRSSAQRGSDLRYDLEITLEEAASGVQSKIRVPRLETCEDCSGNGCAPDTKPETCSTCQGQGQVRMQQGFFAVARTCSTCRGNGQVIRNPCRKCRGLGRTESEKILEVAIPAGVDTGSRLRVNGEGEAGVNGGGYGDLYVIIHLKEHDSFERQGANLYASVPVSFTQAALGAEIKVQTLDEEQPLQIPAGTQTGTVFRLKSEGMPLLGTRGKGDLFVAVTVVTPKTLSREQRKILEQLAEIEDQSFESESFMDKVRNIFG